jgi:hypothetical protein
MQQARIDCLHMVARRLCMQRSSAAQSCRLVRLPARQAGRQHAAEPKAAHLSRGEKTRMARRRKHSPTRHALQKSWLDDGSNTTRKSLHWHLVRSRACARSAASLFPRAPPSNLTTRSDFDAVTPPPRSERQRIPPCGPRFDPLTWVHSRWHAAVRHCSASDQRRITPAQQAPQKLASSYMLILRNRANRPATNIIPSRSGA